VNHVFILKTANDMNNRIHLANVRKELVAQTFAAARTLYQTRNIYEFQSRRRVFLRMIHLRQYIQTGIRNRNHTRVRLNRAERVIRRLRTRTGDRIE